MSQQALDHIAMWDLKPSTIAGDVLADIAAHADEAFIAVTTASDIAARLNVTRSAVVMVLFLAANQRRITAIPGVGYQLFDGDPTPAPTRLRDLPYDEYLQTGHWQQLREHKLREADYRCQLCNAGGVELNVHHRTYERLGEERLTDLIVLCADCHRLFHEHRKLA